MQLSNFQKFLTFIVHYNQSTNKMGANGSLIKLTIGYVETIFLNVNTGNGTNIFDLGIEGDVASG